MSSQYVFVVFCTVLFVYGTAKGPIVETTYGPVEGVNVNMTSGAVIQSWLAVPYARAPIGNLRFEPPQPPEPWEDVFDASKLGNVCMQRERFLDMAQNNEDCLHMNIYSKQRTSGELVPVMVWIHGGGFNTGTNFEYPGYFFAEKDVLLVAINYRLGMLGWAYTADGVLNGNQGLWDTILALQWIQDNIAAFGGDPDRVTIFGESAGGCSVGILEGAPQAAGLFHGAILQSGTGISPWAVMLEKFRAEDYVYQVSNYFGCDNSSTYAMVECLRQQDAQEIANADNVTCTEGSTACEGFQPVVDGNLIPDIPILMREHGEFHAVPEMVGLTEEDGFGWGPDYIWEGLSRQEIEDVWRELVQWSAVLWPDPSVVDNVFEAVNWFYADWPYVEDEEVNRAMMGYFFTDFQFGASADYQAKTTTAADQPAYFYVYKYQLENGIENDWDGTPHGAEVIPLFGYPFLEDNSEALEHSGWPPVFVQNLNFTQQDKDYSEFLLTLWTNFAKHWNPTPEPAGPAGSTKIQWSAMQPGNLTYAYLDSDPYTSIDYRQKEYSFQNRYLNYLIYGKEFSLT